MGHLESPTVDHSIGVCQVVHVLRGVVMVGEDPAPGPVRHLPGGEGEDEVVVAGEDADILRGHDVRHTPILCLIL